MTLRADLAAGLAGSMALLRGEPDAMRHFDVSVDGFWRSFRVALVLAPTLVIDALADGRLVTELGVTDPGPWPRLITYAAGFLVFPAVLAALAGPLGLKPVYAPFIVARNWTSLVGVVPTLAAALAYLVGLYGREALAVANLAALAFNLFYAYRVARIAAAAAPGQAAGLVVLDFILTLIASALVDRLT